MSRLVSEGPQLRNRSSCFWKEREKTPPGCSAGGDVDWTDEPYSDPRLSPRTCITRRQVSLRRDPQRTWSHNGKRY